MTKRVFEMYTDGSYNVKTKNYSGAYYVKGLLKKAVSGNKAEFAGSRNVAGECLAVIYGIKDLIRTADLVPGDEIIIFHDYTGLSEWASGNWQAKKEIAKKYVQAIDLFRENGLMIQFKKVPAHSGVAENEIVDLLAKKAIGLA